MVAYAASLRLASFWYPKALLHEEFSLVISVQSLAGLWSNGSQNKASLASNLSMSFIPNYIEHRLCGMGRAELPLADRVDPRGKGRQAHEKVLVGALGGIPYSPPELGQSSAGWRRWGNRGSARARNLESARLRATGPCVLLRREDCEALHSG